MLDSLRRRLRRPPPDEARWVVLDIESSGLDPHRDRLLSIAAVALHREGARLQVVLGDSFEIVLRQPAGAAADKANILVHGIGVGAQGAGVEPVAALHAFEAYAGTAPLIGFHAAFDRALLERAGRLHGQRLAHHHWLDLADLAPVLRPKVQARALDDWLAVFGIGCLARHQAAADALATAELLLCLWPLARAEAGARDFRALAALAAQRRWLGA